MAYYICETCSRNDEFVFVFVSETNAAKHRHMPNHHARSLVLAKMSCPPTVVDHQEAQPATTDGFGICTKLVLVKHRDSDSHCMECMSLKSIWHSSRDGWLCRCTKPCATELYEDGGCARSFAHVN